MAFWPPVLPDIFAKSLCFMKPLFLLHPYSSHGQTQADTLHCKASACMIHWEEALGIGGVSALH